jgi:hypothetical protein
VSGWSRSTATRVALADVRGGALGDDAAQRLRELRPAHRRLRADDARRAAADLPAQRVLDRDPRAEAVDRVRDARAGADDHHQRAWRDVVVGLEHRGGGLGPARVRAQERAQQLLLAAAAVELGIGLGLQDGRGLRRGGAGEAQLVVVDRLVLDQPQEPEPAPAAQDRDADPRLHPDLGVGGRADRLERRPDAVSEERVARGVGRRAAEDALGPHAVQVAELDAVRERAQVDVVDQHRTPEAHAQGVDDLLEPGLHGRIMTARQTTSP